MSDEEQKKAYAADIYAKERIRLQDKEREKLAKHQAKIARRLAKRQEKEDSEQRRREAEEARHIANQAKKLAKEHHASEMRRARRAMPSRPSILEPEGIFKMLTGLLGVAFILLALIVFIAVFS